MGSFVSAYPFLIVSETRFVVNKNRCEGGTVGPPFNAFFSIFLLLWTKIWCPRGMSAIQIIYFAHTLRAVEAPAPTDKN